MLVAQFNTPACAVSALFSPNKLVARFSTDPVLAAALDPAPTTSPAANNPLEVATAPSPIAIAAVNNVLLQSAWLPRPGDRHAGCVRRGDQSGTREDAARDSDDGKGHGDLAGKFAMLIAFMSLLQTRKRTSVA